MGSVENACTHSGSQAASITYIFVLKHFNFLLFSENSFAIESRFSDDTKCIASRTYLLNKGFVYDYTHRL